MYRRVHDRITVSLAVTALGVSAATGGIVNELWYRTVDFTDRNDYGYECAIDSQGCVILAGQNHRGPTGSSDGRNAFVVKYDTSGNMLWSNEVGNTTADLGADVFYSVRVDADDDVYAAGQLGGSNSFQPHTLCLVNKFTSSGTLAWQRSYAVYGWAENMGLALDPSGSPIAVGREFMNWSASQGDWVIQKYDDNGNQQSGYPFYYNHSYGLADRAQAAAVWSNGSFAVVGFCGVSSGNNDWHVRHYNAARGLIWSDTLDSGGGNDNATSVNYDSTGNLIVGGYSKNPSGTDSDWRIIKYRASDGLRLWNMTYESNPNASESVAHLVIDDNDDILAVGGWQRSDGEPIPALHRISGDDGSIIDSQLWEDSTDRRLSHIELRDGMVALSGHVTDGNDWDMFVSLNTMEDVETPAIALSNLAVAQRPGTKLVDITYDLVGAVTNGISVSVTISNAVGPVTGSSFTGHIGQGVSPGTGRHIVWDGGADQPGAVFSNLWLCIEATALAEGTASEMVALPAGSNNGTEPELGAYSLTLAESILMDVYEVSKAKWDGVADWAATNGYDIGASSGDGKAADHPVYNVDWFECVKWCNARSEKEGLEPCYTNGGSVYRTGQVYPDCSFAASGYRLPLDDEWEYGARGGLVGKRFPWGDTISQTQANYYAWTSYPYDLGPGTGVHPDYDTGVRPTSSPVESFDPNAYGLYDMAGNMYEWCWAAGSGQKNVRSGSWGSNAYFARCAIAEQQNPDYYYDVIGFRTVRGLFSSNLVVTQTCSSFAADFRDYQLTVASDHGSPVPAVGIHSNYCWHSSVTGSVEMTVNEAEVDWTCDGWSGTGSVPATGGTNDTGEIVLTNLSSSITWNWSAMADPPPSEIDLFVAAEDLRILGQTGLETWNPAIGDPVSIEVTVHNVGDASAPANLLVQLFEDSVPPDLSSYNSNNYVIVTSGVVSNAVAPGGSAVCLMPWIVSAPDRLATLTAVVELDANRIQSQANAEGADDPLPLLESSWANNSVGRSIEIGSPSAGSYAINVLTTPPAGMQSGVRYTLTGTAKYDWGAQDPVLGAFVGVTVNGETYEERTGSPDGAWSVELNGLPEGDHTAHIEVDDGNLIGVTNIVLSVGPGQPAVDLRPIYMAALGAYRSTGASAFAATGTAVTLRAWVRNDGNTNSGPFDVAFKDPSGTVICTETMSLGAFEQDYVDTSVTWSVPPGSSLLSCVADSGHSVSESLENNNTDTLWVYGREPKPDLIVYDISWTPEDPKEGDVVTLTASVYNQGPSPVPAGTVYTNWFSLGGTRVFTQSVDLVKGAVQPVQIAWPATAGSHALIVETDTGDDIDEDFEDNNTRSEPLYVREALPDLRPFYYLHGYETPYYYRSGLSFIPADPAMGETVTVSCDVYNNGTVALSAGNTFSVVFVEDGSPFATNSVVLSEDLVSNAKVTTSTPWNAVTASVVTFEAFIDVADTVSEENESNNDTTKELEVYPASAQLEAVALSFAPLQPLPGTPVTLSATIQNNGGVAGGSGETVEFFEGSTNPVDKIGEAVLTADIEPMGGTGTAALPWTAPGTAGNVSIFAMIDGTVFERGLTVTPEPSPNLQVFSEDITVTPPVPYRGEIVTVQTDVRNTEGNSATNFQVQFYVDSAAGPWVELGEPAGVDALGVGEKTNVTASTTILADRTAYAVKVEILPNAAQGDADSDDNAATTTFVLADAPMADAGPDQGCMAGQVVTLDGSGSSNALAYAWTLIDRPANSTASLSGDRTVSPWLTADVAGDYTVELVVTKGAAVSEADTMTVTAEWLTLQVVSSHGVADPAVGMVNCTWEQIVECRVSGTETIGITQYVNSGWVGTGSVPTSGSTSNVTFTITNDSSIAWLWQTNYALHVGIADGEGATSVTSGWYAAGMNAEVEAFASEGYRFDAWTVDGESPPYGGITNTGRWLQVPMDAAHTAAVTFVVLDLPEALDNWTLNWTIGGDTNWFPQVEESADGIDAAASAEIADDSECWIQTSVTNSGTLRFDWRVSCQERYDALLFYVDGVPESRLSGESGWEGFSIVVGPGEHTFRWIYRKGASGAAGEDRAWLDCVRWIPGVPEATWTLTVESADDGGAPVPDVGQHTYTNGERVAASVVSPHGVVSNAQRSVCTGWTCTGLAPFAGTGTNVMLTMTSDAHLTWLWKTQYRLDTEAGNGGSVDVDDGWFDAGTNVTVTATPAPGYAFSHWMGELTGALFDGASVTVTMDGARNLTACFIDLAAALDATNLVWSVSGDADWLPQTACTSDGEDAGVSGLIDDFGRSRVQTEVRGPGLLTFNWRVSCEEGYDWFDFLVDEALSDMLTGESDWQTVTLRIDSGTHQLAWEYWKNEVFSNGEDRAWLDQVRWSPFTGFMLWADERGLSGEMELLFANDYNDNAIPDGFEYAFGTNLVEGTPLMDLRVVDGLPLVGVPLRDAATLPYADSRLKGCTNLPGCHAGWTLPLTTTNAPPDDPENREWYRPQGEIPPAAFFILEAELK